MSSAQKTDVQMLADAVEVGGRPGGNRRLAAAELRRLDAENQQLRAQLDQAVASKCELLEALEHYLIQDEIAEGYGGGVGGSARERARAAIAKATGVEP